jgi:hypothetical protein
MSGNHPRGFLGFKVFGIAVLFHASFVERATRVQQDAHVMVCMVSPPHAHTSGPVEPEVFPSPPQHFHPRDCFGGSTTRCTISRCDRLRRARRRGAAARPKA